MTTGAAQLRCGGLALLAAALLSGGCAQMRATFVPYPTQADAWRRAWVSGRPAAAAATLATAAPKRQGSPDEALWFLEYGAVLRATGQYVASNTALAHAEAVMRAYDDRAVVSARDVGGETAAVMANQNLLPYRGYHHDRIMAPTLLALNYLSLGDSEAAQVELRRAYARQQESVAYFQREIAAAKTEPRPAGLNEAQNNPALQRELRSVYAELDRYEAYADFVNPLTVWLDGMVFLHTGVGTAERERARKSLERVAGMHRAHPAITPDLHAAAATTAAPAPVVYVLFETGQAPARREFRLDLPVPIERTILLASIALPRLDVQPGAAPVLAIHADGHQVAETVLLANMQGIIAREFRQRLPLVVTRTIAGAILKLAGQYAVGRELGGAGQLAAAILSAVLTRADLRTWLTLPAEYQLARLPRPAADRLTLVNPRGTERVVVDLPPGAVVLVTAKSLAPGNLSATAAVIK